MNAVIDALLMSETAAAGRTCGDCTACCTVLAVEELRKPMRWACEHVACDGCRAYEARPQACRDFNCLWLRGAISGDESRRPDNLGVLFDFFHSSASNDSRFVAFELWNGAFDEPAGAALLAETASCREIQLSYRNGSWRTMGVQPAPSPSQIQNPKSEIQN